MLSTLTKSPVGPLTMPSVHGGSVAVTEDQLITDPTQRRTNLRAPILVGRPTGLAKQVVWSDARLPIRFFLRDLTTHGDGLLC